MNGEHHKKNSIFIVGLAQFIHYNENNMVIFIRQMFLTSGFKMYVMLSVVTKRNPNALLSLNFASIKFCKKS